MAVIVHEIGQVVKNDSKYAFVADLRMSELKDADGAVVGNTVNSLTDTQL